MYVEMKYKLRKGAYIDGTGTPGGFWSARVIETSRRQRNGEYSASPLLRGRSFKGNLGIQRWAHYGAFGFHDLSNFCML